MILPNSFFDNTQYFGVSLDSASLKGVSLKSDGSIDSYAQIPFTENVVSSRIENKEILSQAFKSLVDQGHFKSSYVSVVLPESFAFTREFSLPITSNKEFSEAISWQISDIFPFKPEDIFFDWKIIKKDDKKITALVAAIQKDIINDIRVAMASAKLYPISFEPAISALSHTNAIKKSDLSILIDVDQKGHTSSLISQGISLLTTTSIASQENTAEAIISSINSILGFYQKKTKKTPEKKNIIITGDLAEENLAKTLTGLVGEEVSIMQILGIAPAFHRAYAASSSHILPPASEETINLLPSDLIIWYQDQHDVQMYKKANKILTASLGIASLLFIASTLFLSVTKNQLSNQATSTPPKSDSTINITSIVKKSNRINQLFSQKEGPQEEILLLASLVPKSIQIESMNFDDKSGKIQLFGSSSDRQGLIDFKSSIESEEVFDSATLPLGAISTRDTANFTMQITLKKKK